VAESSRKVESEAQVDFEKTVMKGKKSQTDSKENRVLRRKE
jgi:hypothetical protein